MKKQSPKTPTRLELHRLKFRKAAGLIPMLDFDRLDTAEKKQMFDELLEVESLARKRGQPKDHYEAYKCVLSSWGVMCPHPIERRLQLKNKKGYVCCMCDTTVGLFGSKTLVGNGACK